MNILFAQITPCIRNYKYAYHLSRKGHDIYLLSDSDTPMKRYNLSCNPYTGIIHSQVDKTTLINVAMDYDIEAVHFHNRPDLSTEILSSLDLPVVYDCHDAPLIELKNSNQTTFVVISEPMREKFLDKFTSIVIPPVMLIERDDSPVEGGKIMYMSSFYWREVIHDIVKSLKEVSEKYRRPVDIYCSTVEFWDDIEKEIAGSNLSLKGCLSIADFRNKEYEFGLVESFADHKQNAYAMRVKIIDYIAFGLKVINVGPPCYLYKMLERGDITKEHFRFERYYDSLMDAYRGRLNGKL